MEEWKDIEGYEGLYQISNYGRVKSLGRIVKNCRGNDVFKKETFLCVKSKEGCYSRVGLIKNKKMKLFLVHRLVAIYFIPNHNNLPEVNHKDEDKTNPRADNLEWCTEKYNSNYGTGIERKKLNTDYNRISRNKKLAIIQRDFIGNILNIWESIVLASKNTGCSKRNISRSLNGKSKGLDLFIWEYAKSI